MGVSKNGLVYNGKSHENRWFGDTYISGTHQIWFQHSKNMFDHVWKHQARWHFVIGCLKHQETIHHAHSIGSILAKWHLHLHCPIWGFNRVSQHWNRQVLGKITRFMLVKHHSLRTQFGHCLLRTRTVQPFGDDYPYNSHHSSAFAVRSWSNLSRLQSYIPIISPALVTSPLVESLSTIDSFGWTPAVQNKAPEPPRSPNFRWRSSWASPGKTRSPCWKNRSKGQSNEQCGDLKQEMLPSGKLTYN